MTRFEAVVLKEQPDRILVVGDVNSTLACALVAAKLCIPVDHVEAGLRSFDRTMPEEINRVVTDTLSAQLFVSEQSGLQNLRREGKPAECIHYVGNVMIDSLHLAMPRAESLCMAERTGLKSGEYLLVTLHRPSNVDNPQRLTKLVKLFTECADRLSVVWPLHPRTRRQLESFNLLHLLKGQAVILLEPLGYVEFLSLMLGARGVLTDSGGVQEETTALGIACFTMRPNTERPVTVEVGTSTLVNNNGPLVLKLLDQVMRGEYKKGSIPEMWDGRTAERIVRILERIVTS
jgi:UDP-N-acetylglucosamine 2-epimerase (non-hydrolysing)